MANIQRGLWTFLIYALVGPFLAGLAVSVVVGFAPLFGLGRLLPEQTPALGAAAVHTFVWSILPSLLSGAALGVVTARNGTFSWTVAAAVSIIAFAIAVIAFPTGLEDARPYLAFLAGVVGVVVRQLLAQTPILPE